MEHLENDMDDLFQKAGELYPLKTTGSDWDAVAGKLQNEIPGEAHEITGPTAVRARNRRKWLMLLLLLPLGLGISYYYSGRVNPGQPNSLSAKPLNGAADQNKINSVIPDSQPVTAEPADKTDNNKADNNKTAAEDESKSRSDISSRSVNAGMNGTLSSKSRKLTYNTAGGKQMTANNSLNSQKQLSSTEDKTKSDLNSNNSNKGLKESEAANKSISNATSSVNESVPKAAAAVVPAAVSTQNETAAVKNNTDKTEPSKKALQDSSLVKKKTNTAAKQSKGFYIGLFAGPDLSMVKFQSINNVGFSLGALIGYRFNNRLSVESGLIWDKKYYYSSGEYFNKNQLQIPSTVDIKNVNGHCNMFEIPLSLRYDFAAVKKHNFFVSAGLSSYLMTSEYYSYQVQGLYGTNTKDSLYNSSNKNILSIIKLSAGYEYLVSHNTKIRFEPYVNIPLQGVGFGSMPISSVGFYLGITHSFR